MCYYRLLANLIIKHYLLLIIDFILIEKYLFLEIKINF